MSETRKTFITPLDSGTLCQAIAMNHITRNSNWNLFKNNENCITILNHIEERAICGVYSCRYDDESILSSMLLKFFDVWVSLGYSVVVEHDGVEISWESPK